MIKHPKPEKALKTVPERTPLFAWGVAATIIYLLAVCVISANFEKSLFDLTPNELGDFLAGAFSPLAFLWLVLGFLQQGQELRIQAIELNNSVEQSRQLVEVTKGQLELEREAARRIVDADRERRRPQFRLSGGAQSISSNEVNFRYRIVNVGGECTDVRLYLKIDDQPMKPLQRLDHMTKETSLDFRFTLNTGHTPKWSFVLQYVDEDGRNGQAVSRAWYGASGGGHDARMVLTAPTTGED
jgi:hypothetical protein